jgi:hypothetical protein
MENFTVHLPQTEKSSGLYMKDKTQNCDFIESFSDASNVPKLFILLRISFI